MTFIDGIWEQSAGNYQENPEKRMDFIVVFLRNTLSQKEDGPRVSLSGFTVRVTAPPTTYQPVEEPFPGQGF